MEGSLCIELGILLVLIVLVRIFYLVHKITTGHSKVNQGVRTKPAKTVICLGSGGHTTEMLALTTTLDFGKYNPRYYVMASNDVTSHQKVLQVEDSKCSGRITKDFEVVKIPRSRVVGQSYVSSIFTTAYSTLHTLPIIFKVRPDLILCNGPGTCVPVCVIAFLLKAAFLCDTKIVFVESFCRTKTFSLTGRILIYLADNILVQWPLLKRKLKRADYIGQLL